MNDQKFYVSSVLLNNLWIHILFLDLESEPPTLIFFSFSICRQCFLIVFHVFFLLLLVFFQPKVVTDTDETELARQLERLERENAEVDGDDDAEEMEAKTED